MTTATELLRVGDVVELTTLPPGRANRLRVGQRGAIVATGLEPVANNRLDPPAPLLRAAR